MARIPLSRERLRVALPFLGWMLATGPGVAAGQAGVSSPPPTAPPRSVSVDVGGVAAPGVVSAPQGAEGSVGGTGEEADRSPAPAAGGGSKASGGDPTSTGRAQEVGNPHLGQLSLKSVYDFDNDGFKWTTADGEYSLGVRAMTQLDSMVYGRPTPNVTSGGFYNPRSRVYFEGH